jgi:hypothetical protein
MTAAGGKRPVAPTLVAITAAGRFDSQLLHHILGYLSDIWARRVISEPPTASMADVGQAAIL